MKKRVVITGMEIVSSIGNGLDAFWHSAINGKSGIKRIQCYDPSPYTTQIAGEVAELCLDELAQSDKIKRSPKAVKYALYCTHRAIQAAGLSPSDLHAAGTYIGTSLGGAPEVESTAYEAYFKEGWKKIPALSIIRAMPNSIANLVAIAFGLRGPNSTISNACVSSAEAIGQAYQHISQGRLSLAICGGTESLLWEPLMAAWCKLRVMSTSNELAESACRPFEKNRDGMVMADGAGLLVLEELSQAQARGAKIYAEIIGYGASCDAYHPTVPSSQGQIRAINTALDDARLSPNDVHYINAHGTGTQLNDYTETATIKEVFASHAYNIPITAQKAMTGHTIGAAGAMEIIATSLCLQNSILLPTINLHEPDPSCDLDYIPFEARKKSIDIALSNHFAFGGANAALLLQKFSE